MSIFEIFLLILSLIIEPIIIICLCSKNTQLKQIALHRDDTMYRIGDMVMVRKNGVLIPEIISSIEFTKNGRILYHFERGGFAITREESTAREGIWNEIQYRLVKENEI